MKKIFFFISIVTLNQVLSQDISIIQTEESALTTPTAHQEIQQTLVSWDSIRGNWLFDALNAINDKKIVPDRTFPEELTPLELYSLAPEWNRTQLQNILDRNNTNDSFTQIVAALLNATYCASTQGRSYGDPHIVTYDNSSYSFQTVGEFVLSKVGENFQVQARQKPRRDDFSLNTAVAIQLYEDRIAYYAEDVPDGTNQPLWVNGKAINLGGRTYYLTSGGTIRLVGRNYIVSGPIGEKIIIDKRGTSGQGFVNLTIDYPTCNIQNASGLLGNGNQNSQDELQMNATNQGSLLSSFVGMNSPEFGSLTHEIEQRYQNEIIKDYADLHRVNNSNSLFDYGPGLNTAFYTDRSFPRIIRTFNSIPEAGRNDARNRCQQMGVSAAEMNGCIFDSYYLNITPNPIPTPPPATDGVVLNKLRHPIVNSNTIAPSKIPNNGAQPLPQKPLEPSAKPTEYQPIDEPQLEPKKPSIEIKVPESKPAVNPKPAVPSEPVKNPPSVPAPKNPPVSVPSKGKGR